MVLVDTTPINARHTGSINLGYEIVREQYGLRSVHFSDILLEAPEMIYANIFYPIHMINLVSFMKRNKISVLKEEREQKLIVGGQGVSNTRCFGDIANEIYRGEADGDHVEKGWHRRSEIDSVPRVSGGKAVIELTRGCKYKCKFCEYSWVHGGRYREKDIDLVKDQILYVLPKTNNINFLSANLGSYSELDSLVGFCDTYNINIMNTDVCINDIGGFTAKMSSGLKIGIESFDEKTRKFVNKPISDNRLMSFFENAIPKIPRIHCYLIYGLPNDNYDRWFDWLKYIGGIRESIKHPVRVEFSITNFEPCIGTPLEGAPPVDFKEKDAFLEVWAEKLIEYGFRKQRGDKPITYANARGRFGRKKLSYDLLMALKTRDDLTNAFLSSLHSGVTRSVRDRQAQSFLNLIGTDIDYGYMDKVKNRKMGEVQLRLI